MKNLTSVRIAMEPVLSMQSKLQHSYMRSSMRLDDDKIEVLPRSLSKVRSAGSERTFHNSYMCSRCR